jgi:polyisoprenoid-binding protein YceI
MPDTATTANTREFEGITIPTPGKFRLDPAHTHAGFVPRHMMVAKVRGRFSKLEGTIEIAENPLDSSVEVTIDASSINTSEEARDNHIRTADFLDVEHHPSITFKSTLVVPVGKGAFAVTGDLTIRGVTKPVTLDVTLEGVVQDPYGNQRIGFSAQTEIDRHDFGVNFGAVMDTGGAVVGKTIKIEIEAEAVRES